MNVRVGFLALLRIFTGECKLAFPGCLFISDKGAWPDLRIPDKGAWPDLRDVDELHEMWFFNPVLRTFKVSRSPTERVRPSPFLAPFLRFR